MPKFDLSAKGKPHTSATDLSAFLGGSVAAPGITQLDVTSLIPFPNQPFKPYSEDKLRLLAEDIRANGVLSPIIVRPKGDQYEILAGHNRWNASKLASKSTIPAMVMNVDDDTAMLIMVNTNLNQRDQLLPSEKAFAYRTQLEIMKRQGKRNDLTSRQVVGKLESADMLGETTGESGRQIQRYIRLTFLVPGLLQQVDDGDLALIPAVALSYLSQDEQKLVLEASAGCNRKISVVQADQLKKAAGQLDEAAVRSILLPDKIWNPQQEFVSQGRAIIPRSASTEDVAAILRLIEDYFKRKVG